MPPSLPLEVLHHDTGEHDHLCVDVVENLAVGEVESVGDICGDPCLERQDRQQWFSVWERNRCLEGFTKIFMCGKRVDRAGSIVLVDLVKPCDASRVVLWSRLPFLTVYKTHVSQSYRISSQQRETRTHRENE